MDVDGLSTTEALKRLMSDLKDVIDQDKLKDKNSQYNRYSNEILIKHL